MLMQGKWPLFLKWNVQFGAANDWFWKSLTIPLYYKSPFYLLCDVYLLKIFLFSLHRHKNNNYSYVDWIAGDVAVNTPWMHVCSRNCASTRQAGPVAYRIFKDLYTNYFVPLFHLSSIFEPPHDKTNKITYAPSEDSDQPGRIWVFAGRTYDFVGFVMWRLILWFTYIQARLIPMLGSDV